MLYLVQLLRCGRPVSDPVEAAAALDAIDPGHGEVEPDSAEDGLWLVELSEQLAGALIADGFLIEQAGDWHLDASMP